MRGLLIRTTADDDVVSSLGERRLRLNPQVSLRPEPFGALAYHYGNRRLIFLKSAEVETVVRQLEHHSSVDATLDACDIATNRRPAFLNALASLVKSDMLNDCTD